MVVVELFDYPPPTLNARHCCLLPFCFGNKMLLAESNHVLMVILVVGERELPGSQRLCLEIEQAQG